MTDNEPLDQIGWTLFLSKSEYADKRQVEKIRQRWWVNPTNLGSLRLSKEGYHRLLVYQGIENYTHDLDKKILPKTLVQLERILDRPYFIKNLRTLILFDQKNSIMLTLYNNNLQSYLDNIEKAHNDNK